MQVSIGLNLMTMVVFKSLLDSIQIYLVLSSNQCIFKNKNKKQIAEVSSISNTTEWTTVKKITHIFLFDMGFEYKTKNAYTWAAPTPMKKCQMWKYHRKQWHC